MLVVFLEASLPLIDVNVDLGGSTEVRIPNSLVFLPKKLGGIPRSSPSPKKVRTLSGLGVKTYLTNFVFITILKILAHSS